MKTRGKRPTWASAERAFQGGNSRCAQVLRWECAPVVPGLVRRPQRLEERARERVDQVRVVKKDGKESSCRLLYTL